jgi:hypothetical protein
MTKKHRLPCPCCGSNVLQARGAFEICPVCGWEDDPAQSRDPDLAGGANGPSLNNARATWQARITRP